jgi:hypothetical protein
MIGVIERLASICAQRLVQQSLAADGAIACFSSNLVPSAWTLIARRSRT